MKAVITLLFSLSITCGCFSQSDTIMIYNTKFILTKRTSKNDFNTNDTILNLFRIEKGVPKFLLKHYLYRYSGDCNNEFKDIGFLEQKGDSLIFNTRFLQKGHDPIPELEKQIYIVKNDGKLILIYNKRFINEKWHTIDE